GAAPAKTRSTICSGGIPLLKSWRKQCSCSPRLLLPSRVRTAEMPRNVRRSSERTRRVPRRSPGFCCRTGLHALLLRLCLPHASTLHPLGRVVLSQPCAALYGVRADSWAVFARSQTERFYQADK